MYLFFIMLSVNKYLIKMEEKYKINLNRLGEEISINSEVGRLVFLRITIWVDEMYCWGWSKERRLKYEKR